MESIRVECRAKINLFLRILERREDGYHNIETVLHSISLSDTLILTEAGSGISLTCDDPCVPLDDTNTAFKAARRIMKGTGRGLDIRIKKRIPIGAGLGGGSADAAGVLVGANELYRLGYSLSALKGFGTEVGADVPFMVQGGCAVGLDRGDRLERLRPLPALPLVLIVPSFSVSSGWAYRSYKMVLTRDKGRLTMIASALAGGDFASLCTLLENDFERLVFEKHPSVRGIKENLIGRGADGALMTGSGPVVFGVFSEAGDAEACIGRFHNEGHRAILSKLTTKGVTVNR
jgi:4-diphosphocytidyl-2-C-methyl-D-erythritol kinase